MEQKSKSFHQIAWRNFKRNKIAYFSLWIIIVLAFVAIFADFLAYNKPYYAVYHGKTYYPLFYDYAEKLGLYQWDQEMRHLDWRAADLEEEFWPPVRYLPSEIDLRNAQSVGPFDEQDVRSWKERHFLGTDELGRDLLSGLIHGSRISLSVGIVSVGIASIIGILLGAFAGYFGDSRLTMSRASLFGLLVGIFLGFFYAFFVRSYALSDALSQSIGKFAWELLISFFLFVGVIVITVFAFRPLKKVSNWFAQKVPLWVDITISRLIEVMVSIPTLLLIVSISAIAEPSIFLVMVIIGLTSWTRIARFTRGEMLRVRSLEYIQAAQAIGMNELRIILRHALPNALAPVFIAIAFGVAAAILVESSLSFLGIGVPPSVVTWGSLLSAAHKAPSAWWLAIFPGFAIFITVTAFNLVGEGLRDALDPRLKT